MRTFLAVTVLALGLGSSSAALAQALTWQVSEVSGAVTIRHGGQERVATRGAVLQVGDVIATAAGGRAIMVHDQDFVTLAAHSRATVPGPAEQATGFTKLLQDLGNAVYKIQKRGVPHFGVNTPYLAAVVKGTTFSVTVDSSGSTLQVLEGAVEVATPDGGARDLILPAGVASISAKDPYRLTVYGDHNRVVDSPARATAASPQQSSSGTSTPLAPAAPTSLQTSEAPPAGPDVITVPIASRPVDLASLSGGLVSGTAGFIALTASVTQTAKNVAVPTTKIVPPSVSSNGAAASGAAPIQPVVAVTMPAVTTPVVTTPVVTTPVVTTPVVTTPVVTTPVVTTPAVTTPVATTPVVTTPVVMTPVVTTPVVTTPVVTTPVVTTPVVTTPVVTTPAVTTPVVTTPVVTTPVVTTPVVTTPVVTTSVVSKPVISAIPTTKTGMDNGIGNGGMNNGNGNHGNGSKKDD